jgi:hypothetical protein
MLAILTASQEVEENKLCLEKHMFGLSSREMQHIKEVF